MESITLQSRITDVGDGTSLGRLAFAASAEADGGSGIAVVSKIEAVAEETFNNTNNATELRFSLASDGAAYSRLILNSTGDLLPSGHLVIPNSVPGSTTNKLYNDGGTLKFNGSAIDTNTDTTYTAGSGLTLDADDKFHIYGGSGHLVNVDIENDVHTKVPLTIKGHSSQSASFLEITDSSDNVIGSFYPTSNRVEWKIADDSDNRVTTSAFSNGAAGYAGIDVTSEGETYLVLNRKATTDWADIIFKTDTSNKWRAGLETGQTRFAIKDDAAGNYVLYAANNAATVVSDRGWTFSSGITTDKITLTDNSATALDITEGSNSYMKFDTTNSAEKIVISKTLYSATDGDITIKSEGDMIFQVDADGDSVESFSWLKGDGTERMNLSEAGDLQIDGELMTSKISYTDGDDAIAIADDGKLTFAAGSVPKTIAGGTSGDVDLNADLSNYFTIAAAGTLNILIQNAEAGQRILLRIVTGGHGANITWDGTMTLTWPGGTAPTFTTNGTDVIGLLCTAANTFDGFIIGQNIS